MDLNPTEKNDTADMARSVCSVIRTRNPIDHDILLNLVSFLEATLPNCPEPTLFVPWATTFFRCVTTKSRALPSVSALYRLVTLGLRLSAACGLFASVDGGASSQAASSEDVASPRFRIMLRRYLERVSVALQGGSFADELLCAALKAVLSAPPLLLPRGVVLPALKTALKAGTSHMPTAEAALTALEDWKALDYLHQEGGIDISNQEGLDKFLPELLPLLDVYLFDGTQVALAAEAASMESDSGAARTGSKKVQAARAKAQGKNKSADSSTTEALQRRVLVFLGRLGGSNRHIVVPAAEALRRALVWQARPPKGELALDVSLPSQNGMGGASEGMVTVNLQLSDILPRLCEIVVESRGVDRQARVLAAECLHACILFVVGESATSANPRSHQKHVKPVWERVFPVIIALAVDNDPLTRKLFQRCFSGRR